MVKPFSVWWKRQGEWVKLTDWQSYAAAQDYATHCIVHGHITERIEIREGKSAFAIYDKSWSPPNARS
jgi:hypothetical protein